MTEPTSLFDRVGGMPTFERLVARFYLGVAQDPVLRPLYPDEDLLAAEGRLTLFLAQYWGGPRTYSDERGHPRLRMRHAPFHIGPAARDAWIRQMTSALDSVSLELALGPTDVTELRGYLLSAAMSLQNQAADNQPEDDPSS